MLIVFPGPASQLLGATLIVAWMPPLSWRSEGCSDRSSFPVAKGVQQSVPANATELRSRHLKLVLVGLAGTARLSPFVALQRSSSPSLS